MSDPIVETNKPADPATKGLDQLARGRQILAITLIGLGAAALALNLGLIAPDWQRWLVFIWPAGVIGVGLGLIQLGGQIWSSEPALFTVDRGEAQEADLLVNAGTADLQIESTDNAGELVRGELPAPKRPKVAVGGQHTSVRLEPLWRLPAFGRRRWSAALAKDLPWQLDFRSSTGNLDLNLRELAPAAVRVRSSFGDVVLTLPTAGGAEVDIGLVMGDLTLNVPEGVGVKVLLHQGVLVEVEHDERRFVRLGPHEWGTPLFALASQRCTLAVWLGTGKLHLK